MVTEEEWHGEMAKAKRLRFISPLAGLVVLGVTDDPGRGHRPIRRFGCHRLRW